MYENEIKEIIEKLTLEEKVRMIHGDGFFKSGDVKRLYIPPIYS